MHKSEPNSIKYFQSKNKQNHKLHKNLFWKPVPLIWQVISPIPGTLCCSAWFKIASMHSEMPKIIYIYKENALQSVYHKSPQAFVDRDHGWIYYF